MGFYCLLTNTPTKIGTQKLVPVFDLLAIKTKVMGVFYRSYCC